MGTYRYQNGGTHASLTFLGSFAFESPAIVKSRPDELILVSFKMADMNLFLGLPAAGSGEVPELSWSS